MSFSSIKKNILSIFKKSVLAYKNHKLIYNYLILLSLALSFSLVSRYFSFAHYIFDFGLEHQVLHNTAFGRWFQSSYEVSNYLGDHFSPIVLFVAPFYRLFPFGFTPLLMQVLGFVIGLFGLYRIACKYFDSKIASFLLIIIFSFYYPVLSFIFFDYHPIAFAFPLIIWGIWGFIERNNPRLGFILLVLAALCKEDVGVTVGVIGLYTYFTQKKKSGLILGLYGFATSALAISVVIPYFRGMPQDSLDKYSYLGSNFKEIIKNFLTDKNTWVKAFVSTSKVDYMINLFKPLALLPLFSPAIIIALPSILVNLLTSPNNALQSTEFQYDVVTSATLFYATILGIYNLQKYFSINLEYINGKAKKILNLSMFSVLFFLVIINYNNFFESRIIRQIASSFKSDGYSKYKEMREMQSKIPLGSTVITDNLSGGYFGEYQNAKCIPNTCSEVKPTYLQDVDYVFVYKTETEYSGGQLGYVKNNIDKLKVKYESNNFIIYDVLK